MKKAFTFSIAVTALEFIAAAMVYQYLPELIPIHWNVNGEVDSYGHRSMIFLAPVLSLLVTSGLYYLPGIVPKGDNIRRSGRSYPVKMVTVNLLMVVLLVVMATTALGLPTPVSAILLVSVGILMLFVGNYLPKIKPNYSFGVRLPWTLASEPVWIKTHRFGGWVFFVIGLLFIIGAFAPAPINFIVPFAGLFSGMAVIAVYAYTAYRQDK